MELTYTNAGSESITLKQSRPYFLTKIDGTGNVRQTVNTFKAPEQDGAFYISSTLDMRNITLEGTVIADTPDEAYTRRQRFLQIFSPKLRGTLLYRGRQIACVVEEAGFTVSTRQRMPNFFVSLLCPSPFFETPDEVRQELASWIPLFGFALEIPESGMELGMRQPSQIITVDNIGDVPCGCEIVFRALGTVANPELLNIDTGEYIRLLTTMSAGEELRIYTHFAGKRVVRVDGSTETNAFSLLDTGSAFFQLTAGVNTLRYDASVNMELLEVSIFYRPQFLGV
ncbi:phage tail family protein [Anaerocolumna sedimenticola]|uniref:Phage tail family protein n=1 Tax=Anaerocolumna sedimenticola TaxID=2696063 RepID=A0A6P1TLX6_9FIRM|nr:phage tail family protein [Anaerocolumna sedimenticola]QHQ61443.1 phage tail family protein [Anaerocolumna sedimenticola]